MLDGNQCPSLLTVVVTVVDTLNVPRKMYKIHRLLWLMMGSSLHIIIIIEEKRNQYTSRYIHIAIQHIKYAIHLV